MNIGLEIKVTPDNAQMLFDEASRYLTPCDVFAWYQRWKKNNLEAVKILVDKELIGQTKKEKFPPRSTYSKKYMEAQDVIAKRCGYLNWDKMFEQCDISFVDDLTKKADVLWEAYIIRTKHHGMNITEFADGFYQG